MCNQIQFREHALYSCCACSWCQQTNPSRKKNFPLGWKCYQTIGSYVSCAFIEIWSTWEVWRALKKLELLSAMPRATLTHLSCYPNFPCASYLDEHTLTYEPIVNLKEFFWCNREVIAQSLFHLLHAFLSSFCSDWTGRINKIERTQKISWGKWP